MALFCTRSMLPGFMSATCTDATRKCHRCTQDHEIPGDPFHAAGLAAAIRAATATGGAHDQPEIWNATLPSTQTWDHYREQATRALAGLRARLSPGLSGSTRRRGCSRCCFADSRDHRRGSYRTTRQNGCPAGSRYTRQHIGRPAGPGRGDTCSPVKIAPAATTRS
jgi:hypothetical protein